MSDNSSSSTPTVLNGSPTAIFDTLEAGMDAETPNVETTQADEPKTEVKTTEETKTVEVAPKTTDEPKEAAKEQSKEPNEAKKEDGENSESESNTAKSFKFKVGPRGKEVELPEDAKVSIPIDGKETEFTLAELKQQVSGKIAWDKKFTELDKERQAFDSDVKKSEENLNRILDKVYDEQDAAGAILEMVQLANLDPAPVFQAFQKAVIGDLDKFLQMTDLERENYLLKQERDFLAQTRKVSDEKAKQQDAIKALEAKAQQMREQLDVSDEWISKAEAQIKKAPEAFKTWLKGAQPTKQHVVELADVMERWELAETILKKVDPELAKDEAALQIAVNKLEGNKRVPLDEAVEYARQLFGRGAPKSDPETDDTDKAAEALAKKIKQAKSASDEEDDTESRSRRKSKSSNDSGYISWDDL